MKSLKTTSYIFGGALVIFLLLLIFSAFPISGNYKILIIYSGSMEPAIKMGSLVLVKPADEYKIGEVITFKSPANPKELITHRIFDIEIRGGKMAYITKGDANEEPDQRKISKGEIMGKVLFSVPYLGFALNFVKQPLVLALIIIIPAAIIIYDEMKKIQREVKKKRKWRNIC